MVKVCYLCKKKKTKDENISFHLFPKNVNIRKKWMEVCGLSELDDPSHLFICSHHFSNADIATFSQKARINPGSVPSTNIRNVRPSIVDNVDKIPSVVKSYVVFESNKLPRSHEVNILPSTSQKAINGCMGDGLTEDVNLNYQLEVEINTHAVTTENTVIDNDPLMKVQSALKIVNTDHSYTDKQFCTPNKRRFAEPRYISEISTPDVATPERARRIINFVKRVDQRKCQQIKKLQNKNRRLIHRITTLQKMISHLCKKGFGA